MAEHSAIEWTDATWNPVLGCEDASSGCANCYAKRSVWRMAHNPNATIKAANAGLTERLGNGRIGWTGAVNCLPERLEIPLRWKQPRRIFVNSQSDLFHPEVPDAFIDQVFAVMALRPQHTFQVLTKRPERMAEYCAAERRGKRFEAALRILEPLCGPALISAVPAWRERQAHCIQENLETWPLPNVWLGTSVENQATADERIPHLLRTPAAVRFLSAEPLLGHLDLSDCLQPDGEWRCPRCRFTLHKRLLCASDGSVAVNADTSREVCPNDGATLIPNPYIDWVIAGGESGPGARPCDLDWLISIMHQCRDAGVPCFIKQLGSMPVMDEVKWRALDRAPMLRATNYKKAPAGTVPLMLSDRKGGDMDEWPDGLRVRQFPEVAA